LYAAGLINGDDDERQQPSRRGMPITSNYRATFPKMVFLLSYIKGVVTMLRVIRQQGLK
jgi:hypothetical protein